MSCSLILSVVACNPLSILTADEGRSDNIKRMDVAAAQKALQISLLAAENGLRDLSLKAFRKALEGGLPVGPAAVMLESSSTASGQGVVSGVLTLDSSNAESSIEELQRRINRVWVQHEFDSGKVYRSLLDAVLPAGDPNAVELYPSRPNVSVLQTFDEDGIGRRLVSWAVKSHQLDHLWDRLRQRVVKREDLLDICILKSEVAARRGDQQGLSELLSEMVALTGPRYEPAENHRALMLLFRILDAGGDRRAALPVLSNIARAYVVDGNNRNALPQMQAGVELLLLAAEVHFQEGNDREALEELKQVLSYSALIAQKYPDDEKPRRAAALLRRVASILFAGNQPENAIAKLSEAAKSGSVGGSEIDDLLLAELSEFLGTQPDALQLKILLDVTFGKQQTKSAPSLIHGVVVDEQGRRQVSSSGILLVETAERVGELDALRRRLETVPPDHEVASALLTIILCREGDFANAMRLIEQRAERVGYQFRTRQKQRDLWTDYIVLVEAAKCPQLQQATEQLSAQAIEFTKRYGNAEQVAAIRSLRLNSVASGSLEPSELGMGWIASTEIPVDEQRLDSSRSRWQQSAGMVSRVHGFEAESQYFSVPVTGDFDFSVEVFVSEDHGGGVGYGGVIFDPGLKNQSSMFRTVGGDQQRAGPLSLIREQEVNVVRFRVRAGVADVLVNGHPLESNDVKAGSSPWLQLWAGNGRPATFRFPTIEGAPEMPGEVLLSEDADLRGWTARSFGNSRSRVALETRGSQPSASSTPVSQSANWFCEDGVIEGERYRGQPVGTPITEASRSTFQDGITPRLLQYDRPLQPGDTVSWEFRHELGFAASPALGSAVFHLRDGRLQIQDLRDRGSELKQNANTNLTEGRVELPDGWNKARLAVGDATATLQVNGKVIMEWLIPESNSCRFGFFHDARTSAAQLRKVKLTGGWSGQLPKSMRTGVSVLAEPPRTDVETIPLKCWTSRPLSVADRSQQLDADQRFRFLRNWLFPEGAVGFSRVAADARAASPVAAAAEKLDSPVLHLISTAAELNVLSELRNRVSDLPVAGGDDEQTKRLLLALIAIEVGEHSEAKELLEKAIADLARVQREDTAGIHGETPLSTMATLVANACVEKRTLRAEALELLRRLSSVTGNLNAFRHSMTRSLVNDAQSSRMDEVWHPVLYPRYQQRPLRLAGSGWRQGASQELICESGHKQTLFLNTPLLGDFTVHCRFRDDHQQSLQLGYNARSVGFGGDNDRVVVSELFGRMGRRHYLSDPLTERHDIPLTMVVDATSCRLFARQRQVFSDSVEGTFDPWLFVHSSGEGSGVIEGIAISGDYEVPETIDLDCSSWFRGWSPAYFGESLGAGNPWTASDETIHARRHVTGQRFVESLLQYHRPMIEDGSIRYEFFYEQGQTLLHPALGRFAFLLDPERGVLLHQLTDDLYKSDPLPADNFMLEPENQLLQTLPLQNNTWQHMEVEVVADTMTLILNGTPVYRRELPANEPRLFGLFHFKDQTAGMARKISWTGAWPRKLPERLVRPEQR